MNARRALFPNRPRGMGVVREFPAEARIDGLNAGPIRRNVAPEQVTFVLPVGGEMAPNPAHQRFRVLYRAN